MDLDADGHVDLISGSWPGELFVFRGEPGHTFGFPEYLRGKDGRPINVGGGVRESADQILVTGDASFEKDKDGNSLIKYHDRVIRVPDGKSAGITGCASAVHATDWDGDGDPDLLVGEIGGRVLLVPNEGSPTAPAFGTPAPLTAGGKDLRVGGGDAGPFAADWDGDGDRDLVVGAGDGSVWLFRNTGGKAAPKLAGGERLIPPGETEYGPNAPKEARPGVRAKVCVTDWDGDGALDLLVGDLATQRPDRPEPTAAEKAEIEKLRKELSKVQKEFSDLYGKLSGPGRAKDKAARDKVMDQIKAARARMTDLYEKIPPEYETHGWVWLYLRKPADPATGRR